MRSTNSTSRNFGKFILYNISLCCMAAAMFPSTAIGQSFAFDGALKGVTISDPSTDNAPPTAVINFTQDGNTFNFDATGSSDPDGTIKEYKWDFGDGTTSVGTTASHEFGEQGEYPVTLSVVDDKGGVALSQVMIELSLAIGINFQPERAAVPEGYVADSGEAFNETAGYGWTQPPASLGAKDRGYLISPDQRYDTLIYVSPSAVWEHVVPNGTYSVTIVNGDPDAPAGTQNVQAEGVPIIENEQIDKTVRWVERTNTVTVKDGRLTVTFTGSDPLAQICWLLIKGIY